MHDIELLPFKDDYIFKAILTKHDTGIIRNSMISAFTGLKIVSSVVVENEPAGDLNIHEKPIRFDVNCVLDDGTKVEIEMQAHSMQYDNNKNEHKNLRVRSLYYMGKLFSGQHSKNYSDMNKAIQIMICDYTVFKDEKFIHKFYYKDGDVTLSDYCSIIYVELPKIKKSLSKSVDEMTEDERWAVFVEYAADSKFIGKATEFETREEFKEAMDALSRVTQDDRDRAYYISRLKYEMDTAQAFHDAEEKGRRESLIEMVKNLFSLGMSPDFITQATKLPLADIEALQKKL
jgi:predicted transposase/invertase (TIGR01784 family)